MRLAAGSKQTAAALVPDAERTWWLQFVLLRKLIAGTKRHGEMEPATCYF
jgi:hypothetical protein